MTSPGERCKNYAQKYGLCRRLVNHNMEDVVQILLESGVIQKTIEPEEPTEKSVVAVESSFATSANDMDVNFDLETMIDINVEQRTYKPMQTTAYTRMKGGLDTNGTEDKICAVTNKSVHYRLRSGEPPSEGESCHGRDAQVCLLDSVSECCFPSEDYSFHGNNNLILLENCGDKPSICSEEGDKNCAIANESVHYRLRSGGSPSKGESCHSRDTQRVVSLQQQHIDTLHSSSFVCIIPLWVHVFSKSLGSSSCHTQAGSVAYMDNSIHPKTRHCRIRRAMKKSKKQQQILTEVKVSAYTKTNILTTEDIADNLLVFDGGDCNSILIKPPDGINWTRISVLEDKRVTAIDETNPHRGLTIGPIRQCHAFIRMPRFQSLCILGNSGMMQVMNALLALETLRKKSLLRSTKKNVLVTMAKR